jgi:hypothetical protein
MVPTAHLQALTARWKKSHLASSRVGLAAKILTIALRNADFTSSLILMARHLHCFLLVATGCRPGGYLNLRKGPSLGCTAYQAVDPKWL